MVRLWLATKSFNTPHLFTRLDKILHALSLCGSQVFGYTAPGQIMLRSSTNRWETRILEASKLLSSATVQPIEARA